MSEKIFLVPGAFSNTTLWSSVDEVLLLQHRDGVICPDHVSTLGGAHEDSKDPRKEALRELCEELDKEGVYRSSGRVHLSTGGCLDQNMLGDHMSYQGVSFMPLGKKNDGDGLNGLRKKGYTHYLNFQFTLEAPFALSHIELSEGKSWIAPLESFTVSPRADWAIRYGGFRKNDQLPFMSAYGEIIDNALDSLPVSVPFGANVHDLIECRTMIIPEKTSFYFK